MKIVAPERTIVTAVQTSAALYAWYYNELRLLLERMAEELQDAIAAQWKADKPVIVQDASAPQDLRTVMAKTARTWVSKFDQMSADIAKKFAQHARKYVDTSNAAAFRRAGFTVQFKLSEGVRDAYQAVIAQNVGLIRNLPRTYYAGIEGEVWEAVAKGYDLHQLNVALRERYHMSLRRAALISKDQASKARSIIGRARHDELGITQGIWQHSHAVRHPRPSHLRFDGSLFDLKKGAYLDGVWTWPGVEINCQCTYRPVIPGFNDEEIKLARRA